MYSLIVTAKMNDVLARIASHPAHRLDELLPWNWTPHQRSPLELLTMHVNKVHHVTTINRFAEDLGEDEDWRGTSLMKWRSKTAPSGSMASEKTASWRSPTSGSRP